jgi:N-acetylmuramoyl-L-alanine amidase
MDLMEVVYLKIAVDIGHNIPNNLGAKSLGDENAMVADVGERLAARLRASGYEVQMVAPARAVSVSDSLIQRVVKANEGRADLFVSIHMNAGGGSGTEVWIGSEGGRYIGEKIAGSISGLGFRNRGVKLQGKDGKGLYVLKHTEMTAVLVEGCFVDSKSDMELYNGERMAFAIWRGIVAGLNQVQARPLLRLGSEYTNEVTHLQRLLGIRDDGIFGPETEKAVRKFQRELGIQVDGIVGPRTWGRISGI